MFLVDLIVLLCLMSLNLFVKQVSATKLSNAKRWITTAVLYLFITVFTWHGLFLSDTIAMASPSANVIASTDLGDKIQNKVGKDSKRAKDFVQDTADKVQKTASKNANKVNQATNDGTNLIGRKAKNDQARIESRAEKDSARTKGAINNTKKGIERTVDNIKDAFSS